MIVTELDSDFWLGIGCFGMAFILGLYFTYKRKNNLPVIDIIAFLFGIIGLWFIWENPSYKQKISLETCIVSSKSGIEKAEKNTYFSVHDFLTSKKSNSCDSLILEGNNFSPAEIGLLDKYIVVFKPDSLPTGIINIDVPIISENTEWQLTGTFSKSNIKELIVLTADGNATKAKVSGNNFSYISVAPIAGIYEYQLRLVDDNLDTLLEVLPIQVKPENQWKMLALASSPNFELNYHKNHWEQEGHGFGMKVKLSTDRFQKTFVNMQRKNLETITNALLKGFDYYWIDIPTWNTLSNNERNRILKMVDKYGKALVLKPTAEKQKAKSITYHVIKSPEEVLWKSTSLNQFHLGTGAGWKTHTYENITVGKWQQYGLGKIAILSIDASHNLILSGQSEIYRKLWADFYSELFLNEETELRVHAPFLLEEEIHSAVKVITSNNYDGTFLHNGKDVLYSMATPMIENTWDISVVPSAGWNRISSKFQNSDSWFYGHSKNNWKAMREVSNLKFMQERSLLQPQLAYDKTQILQKYPWWLGLLISIFGFGILWLSERLR